MAEQLPEEQKKAIYVQLKQASQLEVPMLADYMWWRSCGKWSWTDISWECEDIEAKEIEKGNQDFIKLEEEYQRQAAELKAKEPTLGEKA